MKKIVCAAAVTILAAATTLVFAAPAHADPLDVTCTPPSSNRATYDPPLTLIPQTVTVSVSAQFGPCVSATQPGLTSAASSGSVSIPNRTCNTLVGSSSTTFTLTWNTDQTSTITTKAVSTIFGGVYSVTSNGTVTAGLFKGDTYVANYTGPATDILLCQAGLGTVSSVYTLATVTITSIGPN